jgi:hypothetical protein
MIRWKWGAVRLFVAFSRYALHGSFSLKTLCSKVLVIFTDHHRLLRFLVCARDAWCCQNYQNAYGVFASILGSQCYLYCSLSKNRKCLPRFVHDQLRFDKSGWNNVGKLEITFWRACLIAVLSPNWLIVAVYIIFNISEVLELLITW